jgi:hypothetical protein
MTVKTREAIEFLQSMRGRLIMAQALHYGIHALKAVEPEVMQEKSNISDMEYLRDTLFDFPAELFDLCSEIFIKGGRNDAGNMR